MRIAFYIIMLAASAASLVVSIKLGSPIQIFIGSALVGYWGSRTISEVV